ncbi:DUF226 domain-containing protein [Borrelia anserina]|uniref:DUF226 domain-containing protein n=1 Tax=Borrelia anserina TaxID=143 RepID=UPI0012EB451C
MLKSTLKKAIQTLPKREKKYTIFHLFSIRGEDDFLGINYSIRKLQNPLIIRNRGKK